jgi:CubicO group peptidase (beta-lactamase class C family)
MTRPLPRSTPATVGVDALGVSAFIDALESAPDIEPHSMMLLRRGHVVAEGWWFPYSAERVHSLYSLSKSFTSTAVGLAMGEGLVNLDDTVLSFFPELDAEITDRRARSMRVRDVAAMASGHHHDMVDVARAIDRRDMLRGFLLSPPEDEPGSRFAYNQPCTFALAAIVARVSGQSLTEFLGPRLFAPLGIADVGWARDVSGREIGFSGLHATTEAVAKLGLLYRQGGQWNGAQLLSAQWVAEATRWQIDTPAEPNPDWQRGYGFQFWMSRHGYRGDGAYGQFCLVLPDHDAVLAMTSRTMNMQAVLDLVWAHLVPALSSGAAQSNDHDSALAQRLASLRLPPATGSPAPPGTCAQRFTAEPGNDQPSLTEVLVTGDGEDAWNVSLGEAGSRIDAELGVNRWVVSDVLATSGGWIPPGHEHAGRLRLDVLFIETPHRLQLLCDPQTGRFTSRWATVAPMDAPDLAELRKPVGRR